MDKKAFAAALYNAYTTNKPLSKEEYTGKVTDYETAYAVQKEFAALKDEPTGGYKISLTSKETQALFDATEPFYGAQIASHILTSPATLELSKMNEPLIECEITFIAKQDLYEGMSDQELLDACDVACDMEIPDSRFSDWFPKLNKYLVICDCAVGGYINYDKPVAGSSLKVSELNEIHVDLYHNGKVVRQGDSSSVLDNPVHAMQWLVKALAKRGLQLKKGMVVSSGTFFNPPKLEAGEYVAHYTGKLNQDVRLTVKP